jgi:hypothetical protein
MFEKEIDWNPRRKKKQGGSVHHSFRKMRQKAGKHQGKTAL